MLKILQARFQQSVDQELPYEQAGFRKGRRIRDQIANIHWFIEKAREFQKNICFTDCAKAFDCVDHDKLWKLLKDGDTRPPHPSPEKPVPPHLSPEKPACRIRATVRTRHATTDCFKTGRGVCQSCVLAPCVFNFYTEDIMQNARLDDSQAGIKIARRNVNSLRYADDTTLMAASEEELKSLLIRMKEESEKAGLKLSIQKTKIMASGPINSWQIDGKKGEAVTDFIFLSSKITVHGDFSHEIKRHLLLGRKVIDKPRQL